MRAEGALEFATAKVGHPLPEPPAGDVLVVAIYARVRAWKGRVGLSEEMEKHVGRVTSGRRSVAVAFGNPYFADQVPAQSFLCAWSDSPAAQRGAALALHGRIEAPGKMPVRLGR